MYPPPFLSRDRRKGDGDIGELHSNRLWKHIAHDGTQKLKPKVTDLHSLILQIFWRAYYMPDTVLDSRDTSNNPWLHRAYILVAETDHTQVSK